MGPDDAEDWTGAPGTEVRAALEAWRESLVDLTAADRLLNLVRTPASTVEVTGPSPKSIVKVLQEGSGFGLLAAGAEEKPRPTHVMRTDLTAEALDTTLHRLARRSRAELLDRGVSSLHLALGLLHWIDDAGTPHRSPILLVPVELTGTGPRLRARADDPVVNPALALRMRQLGIELPTVGALADLDVTVLWARIDVAIGEHRGWHADETVILASFGVHHEAVHGDLIDNEQRIVEHPVVCALATGDRAGAYGFAPIDPGRVDALAPPEDVPLVLDADAAQRVGIAAAMAGHSFVLDGPPGTGKSQTIANLVGCLLHAGKRVLVVAPKVAALDTVQRRLGDAGLGNYLLGLHSEIGRRQVATALVTALDTDPVPLAGMDPIDRRAVRERRERLNAYAEAMNRVREPLGMSLHEVLGICASLTEVPAAPPPPTLAVELTPEAIDRVRDAVTRLGRIRSDTYLWWDAVDREPQAGRLQQAMSALGRLAEAVEDNSALADAFDLHEPAGATALAALAAHGARRPARVNEDWLTVPSLEPVEQAAADLTRHLGALRYGGIPWSDLPSADDLTHVPDLSDLTPAAVDLRPLTAVQADHLASRFVDAADRLENRQESLDRVTARLGLPHVVTFPDSARVFTIADLVARPNKPEPAWFEPGGLDAARTAAQQLRRAVEAVVAAEEVARRHYHEDVLNEPVDEIAERLANRRGARKLFKPYRRERRVAAEAALPDVTPADAVANLEDAAAWKQAIDELAVMEEEHAGILGRHWNRLETDFEALDEAVRTAEEVVRTTPHEALAAVAVHVCAPRPNSALLRIVGEARDEFTRFRASLRPAPARAPHPELEDGPVQDAIDWLRAHVGPLNAAAEMVRAYSAPTGRDLTLAEAAEIAQQRQAAIDAEAAIWSHAAAHAAVLGSVYRGTKTNESALNEMVAWTAAARRIATGADAALTAEQARALLESRPSVQLAVAVETWQQARRHVLEAFGSHRRAQLETRLDGYRSARELLLELLNDADGQQQWFEHLDARHVLAEYGLDAALDFCADREIAPEAISPVLERALYRAWADAVISDDGGLQPVTAEDRNHLVDVFRLLDGEMIAAALADIVHAVEARRPSASAAGEPELIRREGNRKSGHLAVRDLIGQARHAVQALKPCLLMAPSAVSRLLPPELAFDVVILDEASQLTAAEAVACAYRGKALVVVGDDRQLPPTSYYDRPGDDVIDYPSVLDLAKAALPVVELTWHHRSRHEALFAFAHHAYYQGRLVSLPRANRAEADHGVALIPAEGIYRRETSGDNPIEATVVAERVLHHYATRPGRSLGVVALSLAQADAIDEAVRRAVAEHPELDHVINSDDRLDGFFVKSLEAVQGDVRDVMILSIGFGYDENDKISTNFGALNRPRGWRRLNVAITRACQRIEVVSSIRAGDVPDLGNENVRHLKAFLEYAEHGSDTLLRPGDEKAGTPLADAVLRTVRSWGFEVRRNVNVAGHPIDLAVLHPDRDGEAYALGIECDGPAYHAVPSARDRDRLREQELRGLGWQLHRIWSTAWYRNHTEEENRLLGAIERALDEPVGFAESLGADEPVGFAESLGAEELVGAAESVGGEGPAAGEETVDFAESLGTEQPVDAVEPAGAVEPPGPEESGRAGWTPPYRSIAGGLLSQEEAPHTGSP